MRRTQLPLYGEASPILCGAQEGTNLPEQAVLDAVAYLRAAARALPAMQDALPVDMAARMLALHLHLLGSLLLSPAVRLPAVSCLSLFCGHSPLQLGAVCPFPCLLHVVGMQILYEEAGLLVLRRLNQAQSAAAGTWPGQAHKHVPADGCPLLGQRPAWEHGTRGAATGGAEPCQQALTWI